MTHSPDMFMNRIETISSDLIEVENEEEILIKRIS